MASKSAQTGAGVPPKNPFDLESRDGGPERPHGSRVRTDEDIANDLAGYLEVLPQYWEHIKYGTHIRYKTKEGAFRIGGYVMNNPFVYKDKTSGSERKCIRLQNGFNSKLKSYKAWLVPIDDTSQIWMMPDAGTLMLLSNLENSVKLLNENIRKVAEYVKGIEVRLKTLEKQQQQR
jgi:hypothetical protein